MTFGEAAGLGVGIFFAVSPMVWPKMQKAITYPIAMFGFLLIGYSGILLWQEQTGAKIDPASTAAILVGLAIVMGAVLWRTHRTSRIAADPREPDRSSNAPKAPKQQQEGTMPSDNRKGNFNDGQKGGVNKQYYFETPPRLTFLPEVARSLLADLPRGKPIKVIAVGSDSDCAIGKQYNDYLKAEGYQTEFIETSHCSPIPNAPIGWDSENSTLIIMPSIPPRRV